MKKMIFAVVCMFVFFIGTHAAWADVSVKITFNCKEIGAEKHTLFGQGSTRREADDNAIQKAKDFCSPDPLVNYVTIDMPS